VGGKVGSTGPGRCRGSIPSRSCATAWGPQLPGPLTPIHQRRPRSPQTV